jgi:WD40 repeat protein
MKKLLLVVLLIGIATVASAQTPGTLYASTGNVGGTLITIDPATGAGTLVGTLGTQGPVTEIEFRSDGVLFGSTGQGTSHIITIDPLTGSETLIGTHPFGSVNGLEFDANDNLFGTFWNGTDLTSLVMVNQSTGQLTTIGAIGLLVVTGLAFHQNGTLYAVGHRGGSSRLYTLNTSTGDTTLIGDIGFDAVGAIEFGPNGILYGGVGANVSSAGSLITIDPTTGAGTAVGPTGSPGISGLSFVPPPTSIDEGTDGNTANEFYLEQNYPNPFNPVTHIRFSLPTSSNVKIEVFDLLGNRIAMLMDSKEAAGDHTVDFDASNLASGLYLYRIQADGFVQMKKMVLMK